MLKDSDYKIFSLNEGIIDLIKRIEEEETEEVKDELIQARNHIQRAILLLKNKEKE